jgi:hypothetical protein
MFNKKGNAFQMEGVPFFIELSADLFLGRNMNSKLNVIAY